jgi:putative ABC transport system substrate-binding protein
MRRREFITLLGGAAAWPLAARAQQATHVKRIGYVMGIGDGPASRVRLQAFRERLATLGWIGGRNVEIIARFGAADPMRNRAHVAEILQLSPDVIVTANPPTVSALMKETNTIPIVLAYMTDPIALGFVASLSRPGGNITGFASFEPTMATKWLELLKEVAPGIDQVGVLLERGSLSAPIYSRAIDAAAQSIGIQVTKTSVWDDTEIERAIESMAHQSNSGLIVPPGPRLTARRVFIAGSALRHRLPAIYSNRERVVDGGLMSYGPEVLELYRRPAEYVDRILNGANPADLPVQQPTKFELIINLKAAEAIGLNIPLLLQQRADEVIE